MRSGLHLSDDVHDILRGLAISAGAMPFGEFRDGYEAALLAVAASFGMPALDAVKPKQERNPYPFDDLSHESVPFPFSAFARMGA